MPVPAFLGVVLFRFIPIGGAGKLVKCYDIVEKYFPQVKVKNA
jgi:hypothetical protein